jgi:D-serine deaminase-like pyridoxal phosphate-dependent protein
MLCPPAVNDNGCAGGAPAIVLPVRTPEDLRDKVLRLLAEAQRADLDGLAFILAMAAREASRVAGWERQAAELSSSPGRMLRLAGGGTRTGNGLVSRVP